MRTHHFVETYQRHIVLTDNPVTWVWSGILVGALAIFPSSTAQRAAMTRYSTS